MRDYFDRYTRGPTHLPPLGRGWIGVITAWAVVWRDGRGNILTELVQIDGTSVDREMIVGDVRYRLFTANGEVTFYADPIS